MSLEITPEMIKKLREQTGVGIGKCKEALQEANGDIDKAITYLRKAGVATAAKKEGRATNEGMIGVAENEQAIAILEANAETDFVVKNDRFQEFIRNVTQDAAAANPQTLDDFLNQQYSQDPSLTIDEYRATIVQSIGENIQIRRLQTFAKDNSDVSFGVYSHFGGKIVVVVEIRGSAAEEQLAKDIAMHVAATAPEYVKPEDVPESVLESEKDIVRSQVKGKPDSIREKIVEGKLSKFFDHACLNCQLYIKNDSMTIAELVDNRTKEIGKPLTLAAFVRWTVGG
ncbi:MAG: translation elongation factor Ts [Waddliaceae bacterium]